MKTAPVKVSVVVPVYNPGRHLDALITSLVGQSLPEYEYEIIFVDDASTDGTAQRLDALAQKYPNTRVIHHWPNSGWPGTPRNLGMDAARGEYVFFADSDDWLGAEALERMYNYAIDNNSDIVWGRVVGENRYVAPRIFRRNIADVPLAGGPLFALLTVHKMFRTAFLRSAGVRFPDGRQRLEDHCFVVSAYFAARRISILADYPCYHWRRLADAHHISRGLGDPTEYVHGVDQVLDIVEANTVPGTFRDQLLAHWYGGKSLKWFENGRQSTYTREYSRSVFDAVRALAVRRFPPSIDQYLFTGRQMASQLLRADDFDGFAVFADWFSGIRAVAVADPVLWRDEVLHVRLACSLIDATGAPLRMRRIGRQELFDLPARLGIELPPSPDVVTGPAGKMAVHADLRNRTTRDRHPLPAQQRSHLRYDEQGLADLRGTADVVLDLAMKSVLDAATPVGDLIARFYFPGLTREAKPTFPEQLGQPDLTRALGSDRVTAYATQGHGNLSVRHSNRASKPPRTQRVRRRARRFLRQAVGKNR